MRFTKAPIRDSFINKILKFYEDLKTWEQVKIHNFEIIQDYLPKLATF